MVYRTEAKEKASHAAEVALGVSMIQRRQLEAAGIEVPEGASPAMIDGMHEGATRAGRFRAHNYPHADASLVAHPVLALTLDATRDPMGRPTGETATAEEQQTEIERAHEKMHQAMKDRYRQPKMRRARPGADDSMPNNVQRVQREGANGGYPSSVGSAPRLSRESTESPMRPAFSGGNQGNAQGGFGGGADGDDEDGDETESQKAQDDMVARAQRRWQTPRRTRGIVGPGLR